MCVHLRQRVFFIKGLLLVSGSWCVVLVVQHRLPFANEVFYMSLPLVWLLFHVLFRRSWLSNRLTGRNALEGLVSLAGIMGFFWYFSASMQGKMIWKEVLLAAYFLVSVGIILYYARRALKAAASFLTKRLRDGRIKRLVAGIAYGVLWLCLVFPYVLATFSIHRPKIGDRLNPVSALALPYEDVRLMTQDGIRLCAWFVPAPDSDKSVVIGHGLGANKSNFMPLVDLWHGLGYNVLIFDFRGHGHSGGHTVTFGAREKYDIRAAVDYLASRQGLDAGGIIGYGVSFGGAALIQAAAEERRIQALVVDSAFADIETMAQQVVALVRFVPPFLRGVIARVGVMFVNLELGFDLREISPHQAIPKLKDQPILLIHGQKDALIPWEESKQLYRLASEPKSCYWVNSAGHYATLVDQDYREHIQAFLSEHGL
jgi:pimeloyl-ACP methyl ester carboxylesterase